MEEIKYSLVTKVLEKRLPDHLVEECREIASRNYAIREDVDKLKLYNHVLSMAHSKFRGSQFKSK